MYCTSAYGIIITAAMLINKKLLYILTCELEAPRYQRAFAHNRIYITRRGNEAQLAHATHHTHHRGPSGTLVAGRSDAAPHTSVAAPPTT